MAQVEKELEKQLMEAGNKLLSPPTLDSELLALLDRIENFLTRVEQSPSESMNKALSPSMKAIIAEHLLKHPNLDVRVAVAACISEITRITAPDAPYEDDQMKEVFQLIVSSFEKLDDKSSPSYNKRTTILETVAKVRSCVVMLDLECDSLVSEMFQHFLRSIRDDHPEHVFSSMETIMTLILEESEEVSLELVSSMLDFLKTEDKEVLLIARQLVEKVIEKCASKVKPCILQALRSRGASLNEYSKVVANICPEASKIVEPCEGDASSKNLDDESDLGNAPPENAVEVTMETLDDAPPSEEVCATVAGSPKSVVSNGTIQKEVEDTSAGIDDTKEVSHENHDELKIEGEASEADVDKLDDGENVKLPSKPETSNKRKGRKTSVLKSSSKPTESRVTDDKNEIEKVPDEQEKGAKDVDSTHSEDTLADCAEASNKRKGRKTSVLKSSSKPSESMVTDDKKEMDKVPDEQEKGAKNVDRTHSEDTLADCVETSNKRKGRKTSVLKSSSKPSESMVIDDKKETDKVPDEQEKGAKDVDSTHSKDTVADCAETSNKRKGRKTSVLKISSKSSESRVTDDKKEMDKVPDEQEKGAKDVDSTHSEDNVADCAETSNKRKGKKTSVLKSLSKPSESRVTDDKKETVKVSGEQEKGAKDVDSSHSEDTVADFAGPTENKVETVAPVSSPKKSGNENKAVDVPSLSPSVSLADESSNKVGQEKQDDLVQECVPTSKIDSKKESDSNKASECTDVSESKTQKRSGKKVSSESDKDDRMHSPFDVSKKEDENDSNLDVKSAKQLGKNAEAVGVQSEDKKKKGQGKGTSSKDLAKTPSKDEEEMALPKSTKKLTIDESVKEKSSKKSGKRKWSSGKAKASKNKGYGEELVGSRVQVWWPADKEFYEGVIESFDSIKMRHKVVYNDDEVEILKLANEKWRVIEDVATPEQEHTSDIESPDGASETPKGKKAKTSEDPQKGGKAETSAKKGGASTSKSKATPKSGYKKKDVSKIYGKSKSKEESLKSYAKSDQDEGGKSKDSKTGSISSDNTPKSAGKSKDDKLEASKGTSKSKQDKSKSVAKSKGKSPKTNSKTNSIETGKAKSGSPPAKEDEAEEREKSPELIKALESAKRKSPSASKSQKSGKKRKKAGRS